MTNIMYVNCHHLHNSYNHYLTSSTILLFFAPFSSSILLSWASACPGGRELDLCLNNYYQLGWQGYQGGKTWIIIINQGGKTWRASGDHKMVSFFFCDDKSAVYKCLQKKHFWGDCVIFLFTDILVLDRVNPTRVQTRVDSLVLESWIALQAFND